MTMKGYHTFPKASILEPHHQIVYFHTQDTHRGGLTPLQRYNQYILQPQLTGNNKGQKNILLQIRFLLHVYITKICSIYTNTDVYIIVTLQEKNIAERLSSNLNLPIQLGL